MPDRPSKLHLVSLHDPSGVVERVAESPEAVRPRFMPVADLKHGGAAAYEVLLSIDGEPERSPATWADAVHPRMGPALEARLLEAALAERERLPAGARLMVTLSAAGLRSAEAQAVIAGAGSLERVLVLAAADGSRDHSGLEAVRDAGGQVGIDGSGSSYSSVQHLLAVRPDYVRISPDFVEGLDVDAAKAAVVEAVAAVAARIDTEVVATGITSAQELSALRRLRIPYGQGPLLGDPAAVMGGLTPRAVDVIRDAAPAVEPAETVAGLIEARPALQWASGLDEVADAFLQEPQDDVLVLVDERNRPLALAERAAFLRGETYERPVMRITPTSPMRAVARRAAARPMLERYHPLVACDRRGVYLGLVRVEQLLDALAQD